MSAVAFSHDSSWLMVADKFGIVYVFSTAPADTVDEPIQLLAHCCSIITGMVFLLHLQITYDKCEKLQFEGIEFWSFQFFGFKD